MQERAAKEPGAKQMPSGLIYTAPRKKVRFLTHVTCGVCRMQKLFPFTAKSKITSEFENFYKGSPSEDKGIKPEGDTSDQT